MQLNFMQPNHIKVVLGKQLNSVVLFMQSHIVQLIISHTGEIIHSNH